MISATTTPPNGKFGIDVNSALTMGTSQKKNLVLFLMDSDWKLNTKNIDDFLIFSTAIYLLSSNQRSRSYDP
jgi:hypothetical protein